MVPMIAAMLYLFMVVIFQAALDTVSPWYQGSRVSAMVPMTAAMLCLSMVVIFQAALDVVAPWYQGATVSALVPSATVELMAQNKMEEDEDNKAEETDADVVKRDLVQVSKGKKRC